MDSRGIPNESWWNVRLKTRTVFVVLCFALSALNALPAIRAPEWKAGVAKVTITPHESVCMWGYLGVRYSQGIAHEIHVRALAIEDPAGNRVVIVTSDLAGFEREMLEPVAARIERRHALQRRQLLFNASHTHTGPLVEHVRRPLEMMYVLDQEQLGGLRRYTRMVQERMVQVVNGALTDLAPARLSFHRGEAKFAMSRRLPTPEGVKLAPNPEGLVDHGVPVLRVSSSDGGVKAILFSYACHPTTLRGDFHRISGDYPGFAQSGLEATHSGAVALFMQGCGGDAQPGERGSLELARRHGGALAAAVSRAMSDSGWSIRGHLDSALAEVPVPFGPPPTREFLQKRLSADKDYVRKHAEYSLSRLERDGKLASHHLLPLQAIRLGSSLTLIALGGEVVADYGVRLRKEVAARDRDSWIVGYSNDVTTYIPSRRVLQEGGYEAERSMLLVGLPGPFAPEIEEIVVRRIHQLVRQVNE